MSTMSDREYLSPNDPEYYAPRWLRDRSGSRSPLAQEARAEPARGSVAPAASLDTELEKAVSNALWRPLNPEVIHEPPGLANELDRRKALFSVAGRFAAAIGVSAAVALFFVIMIPAASQPDSSTLAGMARSIKAVLIQPRAKDGAEPATQEFQTILASTRDSQSVRPEQSEQLLQKFVQWRQKPAPSQAP